MPKPGASACPQSNRCAVHTGCFGFDEDGAVVPVVVPPEDAPPVDADSLARQETIMRLLMFLTDGVSSARLIGQRTLILRHLLRPEESQAQLASRLGLSPARVCQILKQLRAEI